MLSHRLNENPALKELVYFLIGRVDRVNLIHRQWMKPVLMLRVRFSSESLVHKH